jgi:hypothetical protein
MERGELAEVLRLPEAAKVCYAGGRDVSEIRRRYRISKDIDGADFVLCDDGGDGLLWAYKATKQGLKYGVLGDEKVFYSRKVLWHGAQPFVASIGKPEFFAAADTDERERLAALIHYAFCLAEDASRKIAERAIRSATDVISELDSLKDSGATDGFPPESGLTQTQAAYRLLKMKENETFDADSSVLLALSLVKVYNIFVDILPRFAFAPDYGARIFALKEFFGLKKTPETTASEYEINKRYYLIKRSRDELTSLWRKAEEVITVLTDRYADVLPSLGYGMGAGEKENAKFCVFMAPDVLYADTLLTFIRDSGAADGFI